VIGNNPATRNTQVRGPVAITQARSDPVPESFVFVTSMTAPPRPPTDAAPPPCAPGKAAQFEPLHDALEFGFAGAGGLGGVGDCVGAVTVTLADAALFVSAWLVAVTVSVPALAGAVYAPDEVMLPKAAVHVTVLFVTVPWTSAANCSLPLVATLPDDGEIVIELTVGAAAAVVTVTVALPDLLGSATLVAVTVSVPALAGAV